MKRSSRLALLVLSSLLLCIIPLQQSKECGYEPEWESYRMRFFEPGLDEQAQFSPFYYTRELLYSEADDPEKEDIRRNCREWQSYLGQEVPLADIDSVLYGGAKPDDVLTPLSSNELAAAFPDNIFVEKLLQPQRSAALRYLEFVKQLEFVQHAEEDPWFEWSPAQRRDTTFFDLTARADTLCRQSLLRLKASSADPFLEKRYAYQAIVCHRYYGSDSMAVALFDRYFSLQDTTILMPWALIHKADCILQKGDTLEYNYLLAKVFDGCNSKKIRAANLFVTRQTEQTLSRTPAAHDKAVVLTMKAIQFPGRGLDLIRRIAAFDPQCSALPMLLSREINKLESWVMTEKMTGYKERSVPEEFYEELYKNDASGNEQDIFNRKTASWERNNLIKDRAYLQELRTWIEDMERTDALPGQRDFLRLATAHLNFMAGNYHQAQFLLSALPPVLPPRLALQRDMERLLLAPYTQNLTLPAVQSQLAEQLRAIWNRRRFLDRPATQMSRIHIYLCHALFRKGDIPAAGLLFNKAWLTANEGGSLYSGYDELEFFDAHATMDDLDRLISLQEHGPQTDFERYLLEKPQKPELRELTSTESLHWRFPDEVNVPAPLPPLNQLLELQGTIAFRNGDLAASKSVFERLPAEFWTDDRCVSLDVFADSAHFPFEKVVPARGGKVEVVRRMIALEVESRQATGARRAEIYYQLGNAWFNCSYWGRSWYMFSYSRTQYDDDSPEIRNAGNFPATPDVQKYGSTYFRFDRALSWYRRALAANPSKELAAKIEYMIADCDRYGRILNGGIDQYYYLSDGQKQQSSPLFKRWATEYKHTETFAERMKHCPELRDYINR